MDIKIIETEQVQQFHGREGGLKAGAVEQHSKWLNDWITVFFLLITRERYYTTPNPKTKSICHRGSQYCSLSTIRSSVMQSDICCRTTPTLLLFDLYKTYNYQHHARVSVREDIPKPAHQQRSDRSSSQIAGLRRQ